MIEVKIVRDWKGKPETAIIAWDAVAEEDKLNFEKKEYNLIYVDGELVREEMQPMFHLMKPIAIMPNEVFEKLKETIKNL